MDRPVSRLVGGLIGKGPRVLGASLITACYPNLFGVKPTTASGSVARSFP
jgi:hypothetical protein